MRQSLRRLMSWVVASVLAGLATGATAAFLEPFESGFLDTNGTVATIQVPGSPITIARGINNTGQIVGSFADQEKPPHGFLYSGGAFSTIDVPGAISTESSGINDTGQIVGFFQDGSQKIHGFLNTGGTFKTIDVPGAPLTRAFGINNAGQIVGEFISGRDGQFDGFLYSGGAFSTIDVPGDDTTFRQPEHATGINDAGQIVGYFGSHRGTDGFLYSGGAFSTIQLPGGATFVAASDINNSGQIVGRFGQSGFLLNPDGTIRTIDVPLEVPEEFGTPVTFAYGINDAGHIVGTTIVSALVPEPGPLALFSIGLLGLGLAWRRRVVAHLC
jgi:probable HAF family extracellular repeat protein